MIAHRVSDDGWRRPVVREVEHVFGEGVGAGYRDKVRVPCTGWYVEHRLLGKFLGRLEAAVEG